MDDGPTHPIVNTTARIASQGSPPPGDRLRVFANRWKGHAMLALVVISLVSLGVMQLVVRQRMSQSLEAASSSIDPARAAVNDMQIALALEAAGTRGYLLTGAADYAASHLRARQARARAYSRLLNATLKLDPEVHANVLALDQTLRPANQLLDALFTGRITRGQFMGYLPAQQARFTAVMNATARIHHLVDREAASRRERVRADQRLDTSLTLAGIALAIGAMAAVTRLSQRHLQLAERAQTARDNEERGREELARISASRERLVRGFSHDVRNSLTAADGRLFMLEQGVMEPLMPRQRQCVQQARRSVESAVTLMADLLALTHAENGRANVRREQVNVSDLAAHAVEDYRVLAEGKGLEISFAAPPGLVSTHSDAVKVAQILGNLISNAIKYTESGSVRIEGGLRRDAGGIERVVVDVTDSGPGIPLESQHAIFEEFHRLAADGEAAGAGIGLAISQHLAEALGGNITLESAPGRGSTFSLWLPIETAATRAEGISYTRV